MEEVGGSVCCLTLKVTGILNPLCLTELENPADRVHPIQQILITLPRVVIVVMRYLFAFLNQ